MRIKMSSIGHDPATTAGFTLLELLVVMSIMALTLTLVPAALLPGTQDQALKADLRQTVAALRYARSRAIFRNATVGLTIDTRDLTIGIDEQVNAGKLHATTTITLSLVATWQNDHAGVIVFGPDGGSSGGRLTLSNESGHYRVDVDWLTGLVTTAKE